ncbi:hypothetical protein B0H13DRAFT_1721485 [Mycena leptocephala]|nr:hypothetical protein B0H13DRAFT_1721485 [Mycena leptocephala]
MQLGPLHAWISVDGVQLSEYAAETTIEYSADRAPEASCWIPSECNKKFRVHYENTEASQWHIVNALVTVDGIRCGSRDMQCRDLARPRIVSGSRDSVSTSAYTRRPLLFAQQALTDDDTLLNAAISPELGCIKVEMRNVREVPSRSSHRTVWKGSAPSFETPVLHERSKKAMGHSVQFGAEYLENNTRTGPIEVINELATFVFKYRPIEILRAQGIAPPEVRPDAAASSSVEVVDLTLDDDDAGEIQKLEAQLRVLKKSVKTKPEPSGVKREAFIPGEVIDLT